MGRNREGTGRGTRWYDPYEKEVSKILVLASSVAVVMIILSLYLDDLWVLIGALAVACGLLLGTIDARVNYKALLHDTWCSSGMSVEEIAASLSEVLNREGITFSRRSQDTGPNRFGRRTTDIFQLPDEIRISVTSGDGSRVFIGPVTGENDREVERLKGLVDRALAPPHHHVGDE